jgi:hypothetical protein
MGKDSSRRRTTLRPVRRRIKIHNRHRAIHNYSSLSLLSYPLTHTSCPLIASHTQTPRRPPQRSEEDAGRRDPSTRPSSRREEEAGRRIHPPGRHRGARRRQGVGSLHQAAAEERGGGGVQDPSTRPPPRS